MKAYLRMASDWQFGEDIEVNTLEDLFQIMEDYAETDTDGSKLLHSLIVEKRDNGTLDITIYDDYVE